MKKQILLPSSKVREISKTFKINQLDVWRALTYRRNSDRARMIRAAALARGGLIYTDQQPPAGFCPEVETKFENGLIYQQIGRRIKLIVSRESNRATVYLDGEPLETFENVTLKDWDQAVYALQQITNALNQ